MKFSNLGLKAKTILGSCVPLLFVVALSAVTTMSVRSLLQSSEWVDHTHEVVQEGMKIVGSAVDMETGMRGFLLAGKEGFLAPYEGGKEQFSELIGELEKTVNDNPAQVQLLGEVKDNINAWVEDVTEPAIQLRKDIGDAKTMNDMAAVVGEARGKQYFDRFRDQIATFVGREQSLMDERKEAAKGTNNIEELRQAAVWVEHTYGVIGDANDILSAGVDMETGMRGYLLAGKDEFLAPYEGGKSNFYSRVKELQKVVNDNPAQVQLLGEIEANISDWQRSVTEPTIALRREIGDAKTMDDIAALVGQAKGKKYFDKFREQMNTFKEREVALMTQRQADAKDTASNTQMAIVIGTLITLVLAVVISYFLGTSIANPINRIIDGLTEGGEQVSSASGQVSSASQSLAEGASEQAAGIEETSSSLEEMSSMTKQNADNADQANRVMGEAKGLVDQGQESMGRLNTAIEEIKSSADETAKIVKTIDEIASQTNLLALNAAVEAARAGDAGKGFAVVAEEVRNLAGRAGEAARDTADLIEGSVKNAERGVNVAAETAKALEELTASSEKVQTLVSEIAAASREQAKGIEQVNSAVNQMDNVTQQNAANAEESASAAEELSAQAEQMQGMVQDMVSVVGGSSSGRDSGGSQAGRSRPVTKQPKPAMQQAHGGQSNAPRRAKKAPAQQAPAAAESGEHLAQADPKQVIPLDEAELQNF
jgi:methyl-accepting chemotaxis protein